MRSGPTHATTARIPCAPTGTLHSIDPRLPMKTIAPLLLSMGLALAALPARAQGAPAPPPAYDPALAQKVGADARGMRKYVLVILKTGPNRVPDGPEREAMFAGH